MTGVRKYAVLLCTHNGEAKLTEQLESIASQVRPPDLIFIHDWASGDRTRELLQQFAAATTHSIRVKITTHPIAPGARASFCQALVECLEQPDGFDYLFLCDQDDVWMPGKITAFEAHLNGATGSPPDILFSDVALIDANGTQIAPSIYAGYTPFLPPIDVLDASFMLVNPIVGMTLCISRPFLAQIAGRLDAPWLMHDWAILLMAIGYQRRVCFIAQALVAYRQHDRNVVGMAPGWRLRSRIHKARRHFALLKGQLTLLAGLRGVSWPGSGGRLLERSSRFTAARVALGSGVLRLGERLLMATAILVFW